MFRLRPRLLTVGLCAVAGAAALSGCGDNESASTTTAKAIAPVALSAQGLHTLAANVNQPIYWAGPKKGYLYELMRAPNGNVVIRYLPPGAEAGTRTPELTVATYPFKNALQALKNVSHGKQLDVPGGGIALVDTRSPKSVHLAYPGVDFQVEVFDPSPARSREVAISGDVEPVS
jgi:hypothetical protein